MKKLNVELSEKDAHMILWALSETREKWLGICVQTDDEDVKAEYGMDMADLDALNEELVVKATEAFGMNVVNFSREPL